MCSKLWKLPLLLIFLLSPLFLFASGKDIPFNSPLITQDAFYQDYHMESIWDQLKNRVEVQPFNLWSLLIFATSICHAFFAHKFHVLSERIKRKHFAKLRKTNPEMPDEEVKEHVSFASEMLHFFGEVEVVFGIWVIPLMIAIGYNFNWETAIHYIDTRKYIEPVFVVVIMSIASTYPIIHFVEKRLKNVANLLGGTAASWWLTILTIGPVLGSLITEPGAMTICAVLLSKYIYKLFPSNAFKYGTLGLLFVNISIGGVLTHFAAPPVLMVADHAGWDTLFMLKNFGWKAVVAILTSNIIYYFFFRKELSRLNEINKEKKEEHEIYIPLWVTLIHIFYLIWVIYHEHHPPVFIGSFLVFIGFHQATRPHQIPLNLKPPMLVGFFLAGLVIHGGLQAWWISPILARLHENVLMGASIVLTAFNDNAAITYLTTLIPDFGKSLRYAVVAGAVTGGGLTVLANAPNPAGQAILSKHFQGSVSPFHLFLGAIVPTIISGIMFKIFYL